MLLSAGLLLTVKDRTRRGYVASKLMIWNQIPYCDQHNAPMLPNGVGAFCGCTKDKFCERRYDSSVGYFADTLTYVDQPYCPKHYRPLFVSAYDSANRSRQY